jgi:hypothetical protein
MTDYKTIAERTLKDRNPHEYLRLKVSKDLQAFLETIQADYQAMETEQIMGQAKDLPEQDRIQTMDQLHRSVRERLIQELVEELSLTDDDEA